MLLGKKMNEFLGHQSQKLKQVSLTKMFWWLPHKLFKFATSPEHYFGQISTNPGTKIPVYGGSSFYKWRAMSPIKRRRAKWWKYMKDFIKYCRSCSSLKENSGELNPHISLSCHKCLIFYFNVNYRFWSAEKYLLKIISTA